MKKIKKIAASIMAVATMATSMVGISASASTMNLYSIWLERYAGAPSGVGALSQSWVYTTSDTSVAFIIDHFTRSSDPSNSYVTCKAIVGGVTKIYSDVYANSTTSNTVVKGKNGTASVELKNYSAGNHHVDGSFIF